MHYKILLFTLSTEKRIINNKNAQNGLNYVQSRTGLLTNTDKGLESS
jgi:hypothetical protein